MTETSVTWKEYVDQRLVDLALRIERAESEALRARAAADAAAALSSKLLGGIVVIGLLIPIVAGFAVKILN